jgi:hypothetical protein
VAAEVQPSADGLANLQSVDDALSAYLLSEGADTQLITKIVNMSDANGNYVGVIGDDTSSLQFAVQTAGGSVIDANAFLLSSGFTHEQKKLAFFRHPQDIFDVRSGIRQTIHSNVLEHSRCGRASGLHRKLLSGFLRDR